MDISNLSHVDFDLSSFAFVVECRNSDAATLLEKNTRCIQPGFEQPIRQYDPPGEEGVERVTPAVDEQASAWLFAEWRPGKLYYKFGTSKADVTLPGKTQVSGKHFVLYLNEQGIWMAQNFSRFGTTVHGRYLEHPATAPHVDLDPSSAWLSRGALNPEAPNVILAGRLELIIHCIPHTATPFMDFESASSLPDFSNLELASQTSSASTLGTLESALQPTQPMEAYYYLPRREGSPGQIAVHRITGHCYISKEYDIKKEEKARRQYQTMLKLKDQSNIIFYSDFVHSENSVKIIAPYMRDVEPLAELWRRPSTELGFIVCKHIAGALKALEENKILHNNVNENTILIKSTSCGYIAYLTGFSEFDIVTGHSDSFRHDLASLASVVLATVSTSQDSPRCDPLFYSLMFESLQKQISASQVCDRVEGIAPRYLGCPFKVLSLKKEMTIKRIVDENDTEALRLVDFLKIVLHHRPENVKSTEDLIKRVIRRERLFRLKGEFYCSLEDAEKLLHHLKSQSCLLELDLSPPRHREACWYETKHGISIPISYHEPSQMVNVSQVWNLFNDEDVRICARNISPTVQELRGSPQWEGFYIDRNSMDQVLGRFGLDIGRGSQRSSVSSCAFSDNDSNRFAIVATEEMIGLIFLNRDGKTVRWNNLIQTVDAAVVACEEHSLLVAQSAIRDGVGSKPDWTLHYEDEQILQLYDGECPSEATDHNSFSLGSSSQFQLRKRKGREYVPILPLPRSSLVEQTPPAEEKCKEWIDSKNIRPTKFENKRCQ